MKRFTFMLIAAFCIFSFTLGTSTAFAEKIGIVDIQKLQDKSKEFQKIREQIETKAESLRGKLRTEANKLNEEEKEYEKQSMMLSLDAKETKFFELEKKRRLYQFTMDEYNRELRLLEAESTRIISRKLQDIVSKIGVAGKYSLVFEKNTPGLIYSDQAFDITDEVIKNLDSGK